MIKILVVDDEEDIVSLLKTCFEALGYLVLTAYNGNEALEKLNQHPDLILLDVMMPGKDGFEVCHQIRAAVDCPIIFLTAKIEDEDIIKGLNLGADDYLLKPFNLKELRARVSAHLRREERRNEIKKEIIVDEQLVIDISSTSVKIKGRDLDLTPREYELLLFLAQNRGQTFSKEQLYEKIWGYDGVGEARTITEHVKNIRKKMLSLGEEEGYIVTVWGIGYRWH
ncbi:MAG: response regulator transcription factor [Cellulosilyticum sp.]|nr:response regulator transcription factor [Cellulosilyticum sp.]